MKLFKMRSAVQLKTMKALLAIFTFFAMTVPAWSDQMTEAARKIVSEKEKAVITVKVVTSERMIVKGREMHKSEEIKEVTATVIEPSGLAVLSFSSIDPENIYKELLKGASVDGEDMPKWDMESDIKDIKMVLTDGSEVTAEMVLRDRDLDLAFVRPKEKLAHPAASLSLLKNSTPGIFDPVIILTRLGEMSGRIPLISMHRIEAVMEKPRTFYLIDQDSFSGKLGAPAFTPDGKIVGLLLLKVMKSRGTGLSLGSMFGGMDRFGMLSVILPAEDIISVAAQAREIK
jgi:hypothetical protein